MARHPRHLFSGNGRHKRPLIYSEKRRPSVFFEENSPLAAARVHFQGLAVPQPMSIPKTCPGKMLFTTVIGNFGPVGCSRARNSTRYNVCCEALRLFVWLRQESNSCCKRSFMIGPENCTLIFMFVWLRGFVFVCLNVSREYVLLL